MIRFLLILFFGYLTTGKVYERCELAKELKTIHEAPDEQIPTWVCIAEHESNYNTSAVGHMNGDGSGDHGIFQISDLYWCSPPGNGWACGVTCAELTDDNIEDDFICAKRIHREHKRLSGDGFNAWVVYRLYCQGSNVQKYVEGCFDSEGDKEDNKDKKDSGSENEKEKEKDESKNHVNKIQGRYQHSKNCIICPRKEEKLKDSNERGFFFNGFRWL